MYTSRPITIVVLLNLAAVGPVRAQNCPDSQPPSDYCTSAYVLPGTPGLHEAVMNVSTATAVSETICNFTVGHTVWFSVTPTVSGTLTFTTCHPSTTYDTVAQAFKGGDSGCEFMAFVECNDDTPESECSNGCNAYGSTLRFEVTSGTQYRFQVGSYNNNYAGCNLCLGVYVSICDETDVTPPTTAFLLPTPLACVCGVENILGSAYGSGGDLRRWVLEYAPAAGGGWTLMSSGTFDVVNSLLAYWNTAVLPGEGYYLLRLTAEDVCGNASSALVVVWVDQMMNTARIDSPPSGLIVGGTVCVDGSVWDHCPPGWSAFALEHRPLGGVFLPFDTLNPPWILNNPLGSWQTTGSPDGDYEIRLDAADWCGHVSLDSKTVTVDNTPPIAVITSPLSCTFVNGVVQIVGTAHDANLLNWQLYYSGGNAHGWNLLNGSPMAVVNGVLANWNTASLRSCAYALRLVVTDTAVINCNGAIHNQTEYVVLVGVGAACDVNGDGFANALDVQPFVNCLLSAP